MANNEALYDAAIAGATGTQDRWLTSSDSSAYDSLSAAIENLAAAVDAAIPAIEGGPSISEINLLQSIVQAVVSGRSLIGITPDSFAPIAASIAAFWTDQKGSLFNQPEIGGGGGGTVYVVTFDPGTLNAGLNRKQTAVAGLVQNMPVVISPRFNSQWSTEVGVLNASCPSADTLEVQYICTAEGTVEPGERTYDIAQIVSS
jgi:hypothetical protein